jgi:hypothetical protein
VTSEHDADNPEAKREPHFTVAELEDYPITIVTHVFFKGVRGEKARLHRRNGMLFPRVVTFVDEKVEPSEFSQISYLEILERWPRA